MELFKYRRRPTWNIITQIHSSNLFETNAPYYEYTYLRVLIQNNFMRLNYYQCTSITATSAGSTTCGCVTTLPVYVCMCPDALTYVILFPKFFTLPRYDVASCCLPCGISRQPEPDLPAKGNYSITLTP